MGGFALLYVTRIIMRLFDSFTALRRLLAILLEHVRRKNKADLESERLPLLIESAASINGHSRNFGLVSRVSWSRPALATAPMYQLEHRVPMALAQYPATA